MKKMTKRSHNISLDGAHMDEPSVSKRPTGGRQNSITSRFESLRRQYSQNNNYYDPYQKEQVNQVKRKASDDGLQQEQQDEGRPTKRRKSITSMVKNGVIQGVLFGSALALTAYDYLQSTTPFKRSASLCSMEALADSSSSFSSLSMDNNNNKHFGQLSYNKNKQKKQMRGHGVDFTCYFYQSPSLEKRVQKTEQLIREICLDQQYAFNQQFTPNPSGRDDLCWGMVNKDYDVDFMMVPPPKPKRTFTYIQKQKNFFANTA